MPTPLLAGELRLYTDMLPTTVPLLRDWSDSELSLLQCDELRAMVRSQQVSVGSSCERVGRAAMARGLGRVAQATLEWSESIVRSRGLAVAPDENGCRRMILAPLFDLCNHAHGKGAPCKDERGKDAWGKDAEGTGAEGKDAQGKDAQGRDAQGGDAQGKDAQGRETHREMEPEAEQLFISADGMLVLCARWALQTDDEVTIQYGAKGNAGLLLDYGFAVDERGRPEPIVFRRDPSRSAGDDGGQAEGAKAEGAKAEGSLRDQLLTLGSDESDREAVNAVRRSLHLEGATFDETSEERTIGAVIGRACRLKLEKMPTSEADDMLELAEGAADFRRLSALHYRIGQKRRLRRLQHQLDALEANEGSCCTVLEAIRRART